jgi:flagellar biosynthesis chaperone FliJ
MKVILSEPTTKQSLEDATRPRGQKNEVIIEGLENKIKDHEAAIEKKDFVLQTMEGSLVEAQADIARLNSELSIKSKSFEQEKKDFETKLEDEVEKVQICRNHSKIFKKNA